jgi:uncharacterized membrane protein YeaQ/YmgE (transglycosylase-associated protein family)
MGLITFLILLFVSGLIFGGLARLALPGPDPMSLLATAAIGIAGSFIGGLAVYALSGGRNAGGFLASFCGSVLLVYLVRRSRGQGLGSTRRGRNPVRF